MIRFPSSSSPTTDGVKRSPCEPMISRGEPFSNQETALLEVPKSMPIMGDIFSSLTTSFLRHDRPAIYRFKIKPEDKNAAKQFTVVIITVNK
ncbi:Hypothetical protein AKI40_3904 [Enterobacter sp. FY-07]|nr:Hypothetical protein AKI40_3904 [Enterobacter sp. FY-07]